MSNDQALSKSRRASKSHQWFKSYSHFTEGVNLAYWWSCIGKGLRLQPAQQACLKTKYENNNRKNLNILEIFRNIFM